MMAEGSRQPVDDLVALARARFPDLSQAELKLLRAAPKGGVAWCGPSDKDDDPAYDPAKADEWGPEREIRADLIRWLCVDRDAASTVDPQGIQIHAARITGGLDLTFVSVPFPLRLTRCRFTGGADLTSADLPALCLAGTRLQWLAADGANVRGGVFLNDGFSAEGTVRLLDAQIGGQLTCRKGTFKNPGKEALNADRVDVKGSVFLDGGFGAEGGVRLCGARILSNLECSGGTFKNPGREALTADCVDVKGSVIFREGFSAEGEIRLPGAQIGGDLECNGGTLSRLNAETSTIKGNFIWVHINTREGTSLDLINASAGSIIDDGSSWPKPGNLFLDGFVYGRFSGDKTANDADTRLKWLALQHGFTPQPYRELAKVLREMGDEDGAVSVLQEMERLLREQNDRTWLARGESGLLRWTIGYGYHPLWAFWEAVGLSALGWVIYRRSYLAGSIVPTEKDAYQAFKRDGRPPQHYTAFAPLVYSLENSLPLVKLGQGTNGIPNPMRTTRCRARRRR